MPRHPGGIRCGAQVSPPPPQVLVEASDGGVGGRLLRITILRRERRDAGGTTFSHHIQYGGGRIGLPLGVIGSGTSHWERRSG